MNGTEFGLDGVAILMNGHIVCEKDELDERLLHEQKVEFSIHFFQSKTSQGFDYGEISKFFDAVEEFFTDSDAQSGDQLNDLWNAKEKVFQNILHHNPNIALHYCTTGAYSKPERIEKLAEENKTKLANLNLFSKIQVNFFGAKDLQEGHRSTTQKNRVKFNFSKNNTLPNHPKVQEAYVGYIEGQDLIKLISKDVNGIITLDRRVFFDNVRDFDPNSDINKKIKEDVEKGNKNSFVFKNNGITVVAKSISRTGDAFTIEEFQIVNGCQTSSVLFGLADQLDDVFVPFRLIGTSEPEFVSDVIVGTNSQNPVKLEQFWALRPFMKDLEEYFTAGQKPLQLFLERRENQYLDESIEKTKIIKPQDLIKALTAIFKLKPQTASRDWRKIKQEYEDHFLETVTNH